MDMQQIVEQAPEGATHVWPEDQYGPTTYYRKLSDEQWFVFGERWELWEDGPGINRMPRIKPLPTATRDNNMAGWTDMPELPKVAGVCEVESRSGTKYRSHFNGKTFCGLLTREEEDEKLRTQSRDVAHVILRWRMVSPDAASAGVDVPAKTQADRIAGWRPMSERPGRAGRILIKCPKRVYHLAWDGEQRSSYTNIDSKLLTPAEPWSFFQEEQGWRYADDPAESTGADVPAEQPQTDCWRCNKPYAMALHKCPHCSATNANHDYETARAESDPITPSDREGIATFAPPPEVQQEPQKVRVSGLRHSRWIEGFR